LDGLDKDDGEWAEYDPNNKIELDYTNDHRLEFDHWIRPESGYVYKSCSVENFVEAISILLLMEGMQRWSVRVSQIPLAN